MNLSNTLPLAIISLIGYYSYSRFKNFLDNITIATKNYVSLPNNKFSIDFSIQNRLATIIHYRLAKIEFVNDSNQLYAQSIQAWDIEKMQTLQFEIINKDLEAGETDFDTFFKKLDVILHFNFFLFTYKKKYQHQYQLKQNVATENNGIISTKTLTNITNSITNLQPQNNNVCSCEQILSK